MLATLKEEANKTVTENGAAAYATTGSDCLDLFAVLGALRRESEKIKIAYFVRAYTENPDLAMKILFFARDIRGGLGERSLFRTLLFWLAVNEPDSVIKNIPYVAEVGRYDDLLILMETPCEKAMLAYLHCQWKKDIVALQRNGKVSLLGKWLPSINASNPQTVCDAKRIAKAFHLSQAEYRKTVVALRRQINILENYLREKDYTFDYAKQPSQAMYKYRQAFLRNDAERYHNFVERVMAGQVRMHADNLAPYQLVEPYLSSDWQSNKSNFMKPMTPEEKRVLNAAWASLPDYSNEENILPVIDTSGSMYWSGKPLAAAVALSLGLYIAEHNQGLFHNHLLTFSNRPQFIEIQGKTFADRLRYVTSLNEVANTNLEAVFNLILKTAVKHHLPQEELPSKLVLISDMEFDCCIEKPSMPNFENAKMKYAAAGYQLPGIVFWNVASRHRHQPLKMNEQGAILVSGAVPKIFSMVAGGTLSPYQWMMEVLENERYFRIVA